MVPSFVYRHPIAIENQRTTLGLFLIYSAKIFHFHYKIPQAVMYYLETGRVVLIEIPEIQESAEVCLPVVEE